ncbi:MAG TPA: META domain-containing protein [Anaerolineales bacterium]|nr:META domain-containing protein [Anaerolineales bacterium]
MITDLRNLWVIVLLLTACAPQENSLTGSWELIAYGPQGSATPAVTDSEAGLTFSEDGTMTGNSGCNSLGGTYEVEGDQITFSTITSTLMACDEARVEQEGAVHTVLNSTATYSVEASTLTLTNDDVVLVFTFASNP